MKLYASVTGIRIVDGVKTPVTKGQGGESLAIEITDASKNILMSLGVSPDGTVMLFASSTMKIKAFCNPEIITFITKGEKEKSECNGVHESVQAILDCPVCKNHPLLN